MRIGLIGLFLNFFFLSAGWSQSIVSRSLVGLERTQPAVLERLLRQPIGVAPDSVILQGDLRRLKNFVGLYDADYRLDTLPTGLHLTYELREGVTRSPIANLGGLQGNFWWELGYQDRNWRGRGESISLLVRRIDGRFGGRLAYSQPLLPDSPWGFGGQLERYASREPLYFGDTAIDYRYDNLSLGGQVYYHFRPEERVLLRATVFRESYEKVDPEQLAGPLARQEIKQLVGLGYQLQRVHPDQIQPAGFELRATGEVVLQAAERTPFYLLRATWNRYQPVGKRGLFASRLTLGYAANKETPFAPFFVDSRVNIRGAGNRVDRGTAALILNLEYRHRLLQHKWLSLQGVAFTDLGSWRNPGGRFSDLTHLRNAKYFTGVGLRLISSKANQTVLRVDYGYGIQPLGRRGLVLGLGQYF